MKRELVVRMRRVLEVKNKVDFDNQSDEIIDELEESGWEIDDKVSRKGSLDEDDLDEDGLPTDFDDEDEDDDDLDDADLGEDED